MRRPSRFWLIVTIQWLLFLPILAVSQAYDWQPSEDLRNKRMEKTFMQLAQDPIAFRKSLKNLEYAREDQAAKIQGIVIIRFQVDERGYPEKFTRLKELSKSTTNQTLAIIRKAQWKPDSDGTEYEISVSYQLFNYKKLVETSFLRAQKAIDKQQYEKALPFLNQILTLNPFDIQNLKSKISVQKELGNRANACQDNGWFYELTGQYFAQIDCE